MTSDTSVRLSEDARARLREADRAILTLTGRGHYALYGYVRQAAAAFGRVDSFYIGYCREDRTVVFPYNYDGREYEDPNVNPYVPGGLTEWIVRHKRPYWSRQDRGALLHRGRAFGDVTRRSGEGITAPLLLPQGRSVRVAGLVSMLSYEEGVYSEETVSALACLADSLATALRREHEDEERRRRFGQASSWPEPVDAAMVVEQVVGRLGDLRRRAEALNDLLPEGASPLREAVETLRCAAEEGQTEGIEALLRLGGGAPNPLDRLTPKEAEVAALLAQRLTNRQIADRLFLSDKTVKTHCANIFRKLGAGGRSGVAHMLRPYVPPASTPSE